MPRNVVGQGCEIGQNAPLTGLLFAVVGALKFGLVVLFETLATTSVDLLRLFAGMGIIFTALHGMQTRSSDDNSVCMSVRPSVCQTHAL